jgi:hypothetical protein
VVAKQIDKNGAWAYFDGLVKVTLVLVILGELDI